MKQLQTQRLILRGWRQSDAEAMFAYANDSAVGPNAGWAPHRDIEESRKIVNLFIEEQEVWAIAKAEDDIAIGSIGLHTDYMRPKLATRSIGYVLAKSAWGNGYVTEAVAAVLAYGFDDMQLDVVSVCHYPWNMRSKRVIEKCGFQYEGTLRHKVAFFDGRIVDEVCYSMLKEEYRAHKHTLKQAK